MKIVILDGHAINPGDLSWDAIRGLGSLEVFDRTPEIAIVPRAREAEAVLTTRAPLSAQTLAQLARLRYVGAIFTGFDEIDLKAAREHNVSCDERRDVRNRVSRSVGFRATAGALPSRCASQCGHSCGRVVKIRGL